MARGLVVIKRANSVLAFEPRTENTFPAPSSLSCLVTSGVRMFPGTLYIRSLALRARLCAHTHTHTHTHTQRENGGHTTLRTPTQLTSMQPYAHAAYTQTAYAHAAHTHAILYSRSTHLHNLTPTRDLPFRETQ